MPLTPSRSVVIACAGAGKTTEIVSSARAANGGRVLLLTYTTSNQRHLEAEIAKMGFGEASEIRVAGWIEFCINLVARPYQRSILGTARRITGYNFDKPAPRYTKLSEPAAYADGDGRVYSDRPSLLATRVDEASAGAALGRLADAYTHILVDEVQDLAGYDLDLVIRILKCDISVMLVGDPRQAILDTHRVNKHKQFRGPAIAKWLQSLDKCCTIVNRLDSRRCRPEICKFASDLFPHLPPMTSLQSAAGIRNGVFAVAASALDEYFSVLPHSLAVRYSKASATLGRSAENIGIVKGRTVDHVLLFPTRPMLKYLAGNSIDVLSEPEKLYVAVTRARYSVTIVVPDTQLQEILEASRVSPFFRSRSST